MKLNRILDNLNSFEKNSFLKIIDGLIAGKPKNAQAIEKVLSDSSTDLKNMDNINISKVFSLLECEFSEYVKDELLKTTSQLDILIDIISRDGNCIMRQDWFARHYENELSNLDKKIKEFQKSVDDEKSGICDIRKRDYRIYRACLYTAYHNDDKNNLGRKITNDEQEILVALSQQLGLSLEEVKFIKYLIVPVQKHIIDDVINEMKSIGVAFYSRKSNTIYVAEEVVRLLRKVRGKEVADKFFRRVLLLLREPQINLICRKYGVDWRLPVDQKIKEIINQGISFSNVLINDIYKEGTNVTDKKKVINEIFDTGLKIYPPLKGNLIEEKITSIIKYFETIELDDKVSISFDGYEKMVLELGEVLPGLNKLLKSEFSLQDENVLRSNYLLDYNIKPRDVLEIITKTDLDIFCKAKNIKVRGDLIANILETYKDSENLYLENYENIGFRNLAILKENGILIKEADLGIKFEELTKSIFSKLGFDIDEKLRKKLNTAKDKIDILINLGNNDLILIECKTIKESGFNKFSSVSRQLKSYRDLAKLNGHNVIKTILVAPEFSDEFIKDCGLEYELNLSLITASSLIKILAGFKNSKHKQFPHYLLMKDVLIQEERVLKAIDR